MPELTTLDRAVWDAWNRLVAVQEPDGHDGWQNRVAYRYDGQTWRIVSEKYREGNLQETRNLF